MPTINKMDIILTPGRAANLLQTVGTAETLTNCIPVKTKKVNVINQPAGWVGQSNPPCSHGLNIRPIYCAFIDSNTKESSSGKPAAIMARAYFFRIEVFFTSGGLEVANIGD